MNIASEGFQKRARQADLFMLAISAGLLLYSFILAPWYSTWAASLLVGGGTLAMLALVYQLAPGTTLSRSAFAAAFMVFSALHIHQAGGMIEMHFGIFVLLAVLLHYRDWRPIVVAAAVIAVHHVLFFYWQSNGNSVWILSESNPSWWVIFLHAGYVVVESAVLCVMAVRSRKEADEAQEIMRVTGAISLDSTLDLTHRVNADTPVGRSFNILMDNLEQLVTQAHGSAENINESGEGLARLMKSLHDVAARQKRETEMVAAAIEQMSAAVREVARSAEEASGAASRADLSTKAGNQGSATMAQEVGNLAAQIGSAARTVTELDENSSRIGSVLDVIRGIAEQTNLLALNAAIEAARAGELGRGFAVVADEVRTLASRTQKSTAEIQGMIQNLQDGSRAAVDAMASSQRSVEVCVAETHRNRELLMDVSAAVNDINRMNLMIAAATQQQSAASAEVAHSVANIHELSETVAEQAGRMASAGTELHNQSEHLEQIVSRFRVS